MFKISIVAGREQRADHVSREDDVVAQPVWAAGHGLSEEIHLHLQIQETQSGGDPVG